MGVFRSRKHPAAKRSGNTGNSDVKSSAQSLNSRLFSCLPIKARSWKADVSPPRQQDGADDPVLITPQTQNEAPDNSCRFTINPLYTELHETEEDQHPDHDYVNNVPEGLASTLPDQPMLTPKPLHNQTEKLRDAEESVEKCTQQLQLQTHKQLHMEALRKLSQQHEFAIKDVQAESERQLRQQQEDHESITACIQAQHVTDAQQIVRKHVAAQTQALVVAQANYDIKQTQQQSLHEQALSGHAAELSRHARRHCMKTIAHYRISMQSLRAQHDSQLKQQHNRLFAEFQADKEACNLENATVYEKDISALQSSLRSAQEEAETLRSKLVQQERQADELSHALHDAEVHRFAAASCCLTTAVTYVSAGRLLIPRLARNAPVGILQVCVSLHIWPFPLLSCCFLPFF